MTKSQTVSWIFLAIAMASEEEPADFRAISSIADGINHAVPTHKELQDSISYLLHDGLIEKKGKKYKLTEKGLTHKDAASKQSNLILEIWHILERRLKIKGNVSSLYTPKRRNLNGIPNNITQSFFGTERYYSRGYMGDWLLNAARKLNLTKASLNVLEASFTPIELNIYPLTLNAKALKQIIDKELLANGFEIDFIKEVYIDFEFPDPNIFRTTFYCFPRMIDKEGRRYEPGRIIAEGLEPSFDPFDKSNIYPAKRKRSIIDKIKNLFGR